MNLHTLLQQRARNNNPVKVGLIGAGKFSTMFISQARFTPGMKIVGIADIDSEKAKQACLRTGWSEDSLSFENSTDAINDAARRNKTALTETAMALIAAELDVIVEITGVPEAGAIHAWKALEAGKHVVMVNVEADCLLEPVLGQKADAVDRVYSMAYGDQPAIIAEQIDWARAVGLEVVCAGKGTRFQPEFHYSTPETVWRHYGFTEEQVATGDYNAQMFNSFLDGTKSAIEMCAVLDGEGGFTVFGWLVRAEDSLQNAYLPMGLTGDARLTRPVAKDAILTYADVELDENLLSFTLRKSMEKEKRKGTSR